MNKQEKKIMELLADTYTNDLIEIYKKKGEKSFRAVAEYLRLNKKDIDVAVKDLKKLNK